MTSHYKALMDDDDQCRGKILLKVMRYNIALLSRKGTNYVTKLLFMKSNALRYFLNMSRA